MVSLQYWSPSSFSFPALQSLLLTLWPIRICAFALWPTSICLRYFTFKSLFPIGYLCRSFQFPMVAGKDLVIELRSCPLPTKEIRHFFFFPCIVLGVFVYYVYPCRPSEASTRYCAILGSNPPIRTDRVHRVLGRSRIRTRGPAVMIMHDTRPISALPTILLHLEQLLFLLVGGSGKQENWPAFRVGFL